jgi:hypothetical protein
MGSRQSKHNQLRLRANQTVCFIIAASDAPAIAAEVANPDRKLCPAKWLASSPIPLKQSLTILATALTVWRHEVVAARPREISPPPRVVSRHRGRRLAHCPSHEVGDAGYEIVSTMWPISSTPEMAAQGFSTLLS